MSNVDTEIADVRRYSYIAKGSSWSPGVVGDIYDALAFAKRQAEECGINTRCDDWLKFRPRDEDVEFFFEVPIKGEPS